jgi:hypothetical protein
MITFERTKIGGKIQLGRCRFKIKSSIVDAKAKGGQVVL